MNYLKNRIILLGLAAVVGFLPNAAPGQQTPTVGTFYSLTLNQPPLPFNPFPELQLPVYSTGTGAFIYDDSSVNYPLLWAAQAVIQAALETSGGEMMTMNAPPSPGEGGGGGGGSSSSNPPPYSLPGLKLTIPFLTNGAVYTSLMEADTNSAYDLFEQFVLKTNLAWARIATTEIGGTNFAITQLSTSNAWYRAADTSDSDFDGLSDAYERFVTGSNPLSSDSNLNGIPDGMEDLNNNGIPDAMDYRRLSRAVIFASRTNAYEGGQSGELTILLPAPAPTNGTTITLHLGGYTDYGFDYTLTTTNGLPVTNTVVFGAGQTQAKLNVNAMDDTVQQTQPRRVQVSLVLSANFLLDSETANVTLVDNDLPVISVTPLDPRAAESSSGTNRASFLFRREGSTDGFLGFYFSRTGSAKSTADYVLTNTTSNIPANEGQPVLFEPGSNTLVITLTALPDALFEGDETATLTILPDGLFGYATIDTNAASATVTIADCDEPPAVSFEGTDLLATEYNLKSATVTLRRVGCALGPMQVPLAISGTASNGVDYQLVTNNVVVSNSVVAFAAGASTVAFNVVPLTDSLEEQVERVVLTIKGSLAYTIGSSNSVTVIIDDATTTRYQVVPVKRPAVLSASPSISSPAIYELWRFGRSSSSASVPFTIGNNPSGVSIAKSGDVDASDNFVFAPYATRAQLRLLPGASNLTNYQNYFFTLNVPSVTATAYPFNIRPPWEYGQFQVTSTNAIEGTTTNARVQFSRPVAGAPISLTIAVSGSANYAGQSPADHNQPATFTLSLGTNVTSVETNITATADSLAEGWEGIAFTPDLLQLSPCADPHAPYFAFAGDNIANPGPLPGGDADGDGLSDRWEVEHGLDPLDPTDAQLDPDKDGLTNLDEYQFNTDPNDADTDHDGQKDFVQRYRPEPRPEYLSIRLRTLDTGKVNNGAGCAVCHTTRLKAGDNSLFAPTHGQPAEQIFSFRKGTNYSVWLQEISRNLLPTTNTTGTPTTTGKYSANILAATDTLPVAFVVQDPNSKLGTNQLWTNFPADPTVAIGTLIVPKIEVSWADVPNSTALDTNVNVGGGYRFYPDQHSPTDTFDRRNLILRVKTTPALPGQTVRLRSLDVDDPLPWEDDDKAYSIDPNDRTTGFHGNDNRGATPTTPQAGQLLETVLTLDNQGQAETDFFVTLQPGDNFRVAAVLDTPGASNHLYSLQVDNITAPLYVTPDQEDVEGFVGGLSPMLTVWRKLHLEFDSMTAPPASGPDENAVRGFVFYIRQNEPVAQHSHVRVKHTNGVAIGGKNQFEHGKLVIPGITTNRIVGSETFVQDQTAISWLHVDAIVSSNALFQAAIVYDDDDRFLSDDQPLYPSILGLPSPPLPVTSTDNQRTTDFVEGIKSRFALAYILPVDANVLNWNAQRTVPFKRHAEPSLSGGIFDAGNQELNRVDRSAFWAYTVVFGYQRGLKDDGDPDDDALSLGLTIKKTPISPNGYSVLFLETIRDRQFADVVPITFTLQGDRSRLRDEYLRSIHNVLAHELGHAPGDHLEGHDHAERDLMGKGPPDNTAIYTFDNIPALRFSPATISRFRAAHTWAE